MRLGFHSHIPAAKTSEGKIATPGYQGRFLDSLAHHCEHLCCFLHTPTSGEILDYIIQGENVSLIDIGPHVSVPKRLWHAKQFTAPLLANRHKLDALFIRGPSPLLPAFAQADKELPVCLHLVANQLAGIDDLPQPRWRKEAIRLWARWNQWQQDRIVKRSLTLVNSRQLYEQLRPFVPRLYEIRTTTLMAEDFYHRNDTCSSPPYQLLYTGRIARAKGLLEMVEALALLVSHGEDVILNLVGWPQKNDNVLEEIHALARERRVADRMKYHGYKAVGPELFAYYQQADIYLLASLSSEGFPRTIWEAMAHSLPVVATKVGSIPHFLQGAAELVEPRDASKLEIGISHIIHNQDLRKELIIRGRKLALNNTLELEIGKMVECIKQWLEK